MCIASYWLLKPRLQMCLRFYLLRRGLQGHVGKEHGKSPAIYHKGIVAFNPHSSPTVVEPWA